MQALNHALLIRLRQKQLHSLAHRDGECDVCQRLWRTYWRVEDLLSKCNKFRRFKPWFYLVTNIWSHDPELDLLRTHEQCLCFQIFVVEEDVIFADLATSQNLSYNKKKSHNWNNHTHNRNGFGYNPGRSPSGSQVKDITTTIAHSASSVGSLATRSSTATTVLMSIFKVIAPPTIPLQLTNPTTTPKCKLCLHSSYDKWWILVLRCQCNTSSNPRCPHSLRCPTIPRNWQSDCW